MHEAQILSYYLDRLKRIAVQDFSEAYYKFDNVWFC